jgi:transcriptional regulator with XRE-family HTH domain
MSDDEQAQELRRFLKERRARLRPEDVGLPSTGRRRVPGLRREEVATLAGIGVSWYTSLENGDAAGVSETTLHMVADALRLTSAEREYLCALAGQAQIARGPETAAPLAIETMHAIAFPAYIITPSWDVIDCNAAFRRVWNIAAGEIHFNAFERLYLEPASQTMHGAHLAQNVRPVLAMLHSSVGRQSSSPTLRLLRDRILADHVLREIWNEYEISSPLQPNACTIESAIGTFNFETLTLPVSASHAIVVHVPDHASRLRLAAASCGQSLRT